LSSGIGTHMPGILSAQTICSRIINYIDLSPPAPVAWYWSFGEPSSGTADTSTLQNPTHAYNYPGYYTALLWVKYPPNNWVWDTIPILIPAFSRFDFSTSCPSTATFYDRSLYTPGTPITSWNWAFGDATTSTAQNPVHTYPTGGTYSVTLTITAGGCTFYRVRDVTVPYTPTANFSFPNVACAGTPTQFTDLSNGGGGGTNIVQWSWNFGDGSGSVLQNPLRTYAPGTYTVSLWVMNASGCTAVISKSLTIGNTTTTGTITANKAIVNNQITFCEGDSVTLTGPNATTWLWSTGATTQSVKVKLAGTYAVNTFSTGVCLSNTPSVDVILRPLPTFSMNPTNPKLCSGSNVQLYGNNISGAPTYRWYNSAGAIAFATNSWYYATAAGSYTLVTTLSGCTYSKTTTVTGVPSPGVSILGPSGLCTGEKAILTANVVSGTSPYSYYWGGGQITNKINIFQGDAYSLSVQDANGCWGHANQQVDDWPMPDLSSVPVGCYTKCVSEVVLGPSGYSSYTWRRNGALFSNAQNITITQSGTYYLVLGTAFGCRDSSQELTMTIVPNPVANAGIDTMICPGDQAQLHGSGPGAIIIQWTPSGSLSSSSIFNPIATPGGAMYTGVGYELEITDKYGCKDKDSVLVNLKNCNWPIVQSSNDSICKGSCGVLSTTLSPGTGTPPYTYSWSSGNTGVGPHNVCPTQTTVYTLTVVDTYTMTTYDTVTVYVYPDMTLNATSTNVKCNAAANGSATVTVAGGTPSFSYSWAATGGTTSATAAILGPGGYTVTVTDYYGCTKTATVTITEPPLLTANPSANPSSCGLSNGSAGVVAGGGTPSYTYIWNTGATTSSISNILANTYTVIVRDANNCSVTAITTVTNTSSATINNINTTLTFCNTSCDGTASAVVAGGATPYTYRWSNGSTNINTTGLCSGVHSLTVTDANSCQALANYTITSPPALTATVTPVNVSCNTGSNGSASVAAAGGTGSYTYLWNNGQTTSTATGLVAAGYSVTVRDANGCTVQATTNITQPSIITITITTTSVTCFGGSNGKVSSSVSGGTGAYTYSWSNTGTTQNISGLTAGGYTLTVTDNNGCTQTASGNVIQPALLTATASAVKSNCSLANGSASVAVGGGTGAYTYSWSTGGVTAGISNLMSGSYTITVTDVNGCTAIDIANVGNNASPTIININTTPTLCKLSCDGTASPVIAGGTMPFTYQWSGGGAAATASNLCSGVYSLTVTDTYGCAAIGSFTITSPSAVTATITPTYISCNGGNNGTATVTPGGGTGAYTYSWSNGQTTIASTGLVAGVYSVTVTDANGCIAVAATNITEPPLINISITTSSVSCALGTNGTLNANVVGGVGPYSYTWVDAFGSTIANISSLPAGSYTLTVTDANNCTQIDSATITQPSIIFSVGLTGTNIKCFNGSDGSAVSNVVGGLAPYTYSWSNSATTPNITNVVAGVYSLTVTDSNGCVTTDTVTLTQPTLFTTSITATTNILCTGGNNGSATVTASGGVLPYTYSWNNAQVTPTAILLTAGSYTVTVSDANGICAVTAVAVITEPPLLTATISAQTNILCYAGNNGNATVLAGGGTPAYTYIWGNGQTTTVSTGLIAGLYNVTVTDNNGCTTRTTATITEPPPLTVTITPTDLLCNNISTGQITSNVAGGTGAYTYSWSNAQATANINNLAAGGYTLTVTDNNGCTVQEATLLTQPTAITLTVTSTADHCNLSDGTATVQAGGGTPNYSYSWSNTTQTTSTVTGLTAGAYTVTITDNNNCTQQITGAVLPEVADTLQLVSITNTSCNGVCDGIATLQMSANNYAPYNYTWSTAPAQNTLTATSLCAGVYTCTVQDVNGCKDFMSVTITSPSILTSSISAHVDLLCNGNTNGAATVSAGGGTPAYTYSWNNAQTNPTATGLIANTYTVTVTDNNGCTAQTTATITEPPALTLTITPTDLLCNNISTGQITSNVAGGTGAYTYSWSNAQATANISNLAAGGYTLTVTDNNGCTVQEATLLTQPTAITLTVTSTADHCNLSDGTATVQAGGGTPNYSYSWSNTSQTTTTVTGLTAGAYTVTITDNNNCTQQITGAVLPEVADTLQLNSITNTSCNTACDGIATLQMSANNYAPYNYTWSTAPAQNTLTATALCAGVYTCTVQDVNGCKDVMSVTITEPAPITITLTPTNTRCFADSNGSISTTVSGGTPAYTYSWSNTEATQNITNLASGIYTVTVTDSHNCVATATVQITDPPLLVAVIAPPAAVCYGQQPSITSNANGGTPGYGYLWNTGQNSPNIQPLPTPTQNTSYTLTVTDNNGCTAQAVTEVTVHALPVVSFTVDLRAGCSPLCVNFTNNTANSQSQHWNFGDNDSTSQNNANPYHCYIDTGSYNVTLTLTDMNGCSNSQTINNYITVYPDPVASFTAVPQPTTVLNTVIQFTDQSKQAITWDWSFGDVPMSGSTEQNPKYTYPNKDTGTYEVRLIVTNQFGCADTTYGNIIILPDYVLYVPNTFTPNGDGLNDIFLPLGIGIDIEKYEFWIFDRWGNMIFESEDPSLGWDGRVQGGRSGEVAQQDTYVWLIKLKDVLGVKHKYVGHVNLIK